MRFLTLAPLLAVLCAPALAGPLTFDAALRRAQADAPSLHARSLMTEAARAARQAAGTLPDPTLSFGIDSFPISGPLAFRPSRDNFTMARLGFSQSLPNLAKRHAAQARADTDIAAAQAGGVVEARQVQVATAIAWIDLAYAQRRLAALDTLLTQLSHVVDTTPRSVTAGTARSAQTVSGRQAIAAMQDRRAELVSQIAAARAMLTRWTGEADPETTGPMPEFAVDPAALRAALDDQPSIRLIDAQHAQADAGVRLAQANRRPDFGVNLAYQRRDPQFGDYVSAGVSISLPNFTRRRQSAEIAAATAQEGQVAADREAARRDIAASLDRDLADHVMHHEQWMRARDTLQPLAQERVRLDTASYAAGRASLIDIADAYAALADATLTTLDREAMVAADGARLSLTYRSDRS